MKSWFLVGAVTCAFAGAAHAQEKTFDASVPANIAKALQDAGYKAELKTGDDGDPYISSAANGSNFTVDFYGCKDGKCGSFQFDSWYKPESIFTDALINDWNVNKRFLRIGRDSKGQLREYLDVTGVGNMTQANFADVVDWFQVMDADLAKYLDAKRIAVKPDATAKTGKAN